MNQNINLEQLRSCPVPTWEELTQRVWGERKRLQEIQLEAMRNVPIILEGE